MNVNNRSAVHLPSVDEVVDHTDDADTAKHNNAIVHKFDWWVVEEREETHHGLLDTVKDGDDVDWNTL